MKLCKKCKELKHDSKFEYQRAVCRKCLKDERWQKSLTLQRKLDLLEHHMKYCQLEDEEAFNLEPKEPHDST